jgi:hypothetical protein
MAVVYKVLRHSRKDGKLYSCIRHAWVLEYKPGVATKPKRKSFLYAFMRLEDAKRFAFVQNSDAPKHDRFEVWEAEGEVVDAYPYYSFYGDGESFQEFWRKVVKRPCDISNLNCGIVWCKWLKLKRRAA